MRQRQFLERSVTDFKRLLRDYDDALTLIDLGESEGDEGSIREGETALKRIGEEAHRRSVEALLSGEADTMNTYLEVHAGAGGTESQDWASMLARMYMRWGERRGYKVKLIDQSDGEEAGIKSGTIEIEGDNAFGWLKNRIWGASLGADFALRFQRPPPHVVCLCHRLPGDRRYH